MVLFGPDILPMATAECNSTCIRSCFNCFNELLEAHSFWTNCGWPAQPTKKKDDCGESEELIRMYFNSGYTYDVILEFLNKYHGIRISMSTGMSILCGKYSKK